MLQAFEEEEEEVYLVKLRSRKVREGTEEKA
jgi:hypothetical protein